MNVGDLVGIQWKEGIGYVGSKTGAYVGLILEKDNQHATLDMYIVYCPAIKAFNSSYSLQEQLASTANLSLANSILSVLTYSSPKYSFIPLCFGLIFKPAK